MVKFGHSFKSEFRGVFWGQFKHDRLFFCPKSRQVHSNKKLQKMSFDVFEMIFGIFEMSFGVLEMSLAILEMSFSFLEMSFGVLEMSSCFVLEINWFVKLNFSGGNSNCQKGLV